MARHEQFAPRGEMQSHRIRRGVDNGHNSRGIDIPLKQGDVTVITPGVRGAAIAGDQMLLAKIMRGEDRYRS